MKRLCLSLWLSCIAAAFLPAQNTGWDLTRLDTARQTAYLSRAEQDIILELNKVRSDPPRYAELYIKPRLDYFKGLRYSAPGMLPVNTKEGRPAVEECYNALRQMAPAPILYPREGLLRAASDHSRDMSRNKVQGHTGSDGSSPSDRAARFGRGTAVESTAYGFYLTMQDFVQEMLIDDGMPSRQHRDALMDKDYDYAGVSRADSADYTYVFVFLFSSHFASFNHPEEEREMEAKLTSVMNSRSDRDFNNWNINSLDTASDVNYLSAIEKDIILEINAFRSDPQKYVRLYGTPNTQGYNAIVNSNIRPLERFSLEQGLCRAAKDSNGGLAVRVGRYGDLLGGKCVEITARGYFKSGREIVIQLLNGANREYLISEDYWHFGVSVRVDIDHGLVAMIDFAEVYSSN